MRVRIGLLGYGNVGAPLAALIERTRPEIARRTGVDLEVHRVAVRDLDKTRSVPIPSGLGTTDAMGLCSGEEVDLVVEVMGAVDPAHDLLAAALSSGKPVVTANKELMATHGHDLLAAADEAGVDLLFEAAVGGGIPFIRPLRESLMGERIRRVMGIVNGTTNYILDQMTSHGTSYADALAEAQRLGYAEPDPTADVEGHDSAAKAAIIASIAFGAAVTASDVHCEGISGITADDITDAARLWFVIKLLAITEPTDTGIGVRV
ncbi:MAG TPA: homoserine dehydrogenase, partial [Acidimicrobiales bacterium]|nr:homoserine dehydrogenase [Acidimicrobiales bacterium]